MKIAFLDRDGTINKDYADQDWANVSEPELMEGVVQALKAIRNKGYQIIIITNQYIIHDGIISFEQYETFSNKLLEKLEVQDIDILDVFYCPHSKKEACSCCKPNTGLIKQAMEKYPSIELEKSFLVGDSLCDVELGNRLGIKTFGIQIKSTVYEYIPICTLLDILPYLQ